MKIEHLQLTVAIKDMQASIWTVDDPSNVPELLITFTLQQGTLIHHPMAETTTPSLLNFTPVLNLTTPLFVFYLTLLYKHRSSRVSEGYCNWGEP